MPRFENIVHMVDGRDLSKKLHIALYDDQEWTTWQCSGFKDLDSKNPYGKSWNHSKGCRICGSTGVG